MRFTPDSISFESVNVFSVNAAPEPVMAELRGTITGPGGAHGDLTIRLTNDEIAALRAVIDPIAKRFLQSVTGASVGA